MRDGIIYFPCQAGQVSRVLVDSTTSDPPARSTRWKMVRHLVAACAAVFVVIAGWRLAMRWDPQSVDLHPLWLAPAWLFASCAMGAQFGAWHLLVRGWTGTSPPFAPSLRLYLDSQLARYTPGKIGLAAVRIAGSQRLGVTPRVMASTLLSEVASWCVWGLLIGGVLLAMASFRVGVLSWASLPLGALGMGALLGVVALTLVPRTKMPARLVRAVGASGQGPLLPWQTGAFHALHFLSWTVAGVFLALALGATTAAGPVVGAALCLSVIAGFVAFLAPAGAGVREVVLASLTEPVLGAAGALSLSLLARAISLTSDVVLWVAVRHWTAPSRQRSSS